MRNSIPMWVFWLSAGLAVAATVGDYLTSARGLAHGTYESNKLNRDKFGYFSPSKFLLWKGLMFAVPFVLGIVTGETLTSLALLMIAGLNGYKTVANYLMQKGARERQIGLLRSLRDTGTGALNFVEYSGRWRARRFEWFYSDNPDGLEAQRIVTRAIIDYANTPESNWFENTDLKEIK